MLVLYCSVEGGWLVCVFFRLRTGCALLYMREGQVEKVSVAEILQ